MVLSLAEKMAVRKAIESWALQKVARSVDRKVLQMAGVLASPRVEKMVVWRVG